MNQTQLAAHSPTLSYSLALPSPVGLPHLSYDPARQLPVNTMPRVHGSVDGSWVMSYVFTTAPISRLNSSHTSRIGSLNEDSVGA